MILKSIAFIMPSGELCIIKSGVKLQTSNKIRCEKNNSTAKVEELILLINTSS